MILWYFCILYLQKRPTSESCRKSTSRISNLERLRYVSIQVACSSLPRVEICSDTDSSIFESKNT